MSLISIIVPCLNSPVIGQTLESLNNQDYSKPFEVVVVGQDSFKQIQENGKITFVYTPTPLSPASARNLGTRKAQGDILVFIDADCIAKPNWLIEIARHYENFDEYVVGGSVDFPSDNFWTFCDNLATFHEYLETDKSGFRKILPSLNLSMRKNCMEEIGLFDERYPYPAGEDADLTLRLHQRGYPLLFDPKISICHMPQRRTPDSVFRHAFQFGRFSVRSDSRYFDYLHVHPLLRIWWIVILLSPFLSGFVILKILRHSGVKPAWIPALPIVFLAKIFWCFGAAQTLKRGSPFTE